jgi:hypothetical protein
VRLEISAEAVPIHDGAGGWREAFAAGEDYQLLACGPTCPEGFTRIGDVGAGERGAAILADGAAHDAGSLGWDHGSSNTDSSSTSGRAASRRPSANRDKDTMGGETPPPLH